MDTRYEKKKKGKKDRLAYPRRFFFGSLAEFYSRSTAGLPYKWWHYTHPTHPPSPRLLATARVVALQLSIFQTLIVHGSAPPPFR